jgi:hypothetical protein
MAEYGMFDDEIGVQISNGCGGSITGLSLTSLIGVGRCASWEWVVLTDTEHDFGTIHASIVKPHKSFFLEAMPVPIDGVHLGMGKAVPTITFTDPEGLRWQREGDSEPRRVLS